MKMKTGVELIAEDRQVQTGTLVNKKFCHFQLYCKNCYELIYVDQYDVYVTKTGKPRKSEVRRVFSLPEFNEVKACPCCSKAELSKVFGYEPEPSNLIKKQ
jgi:hypothetical protein